MKKTKFKELLKDLFFFDDLNFSFNKNKFTYFCILNNLSFIFFYIFKLSLNIFFMEEFI